MASQQQGVGWVILYREKKGEREKEERVSKWRRTGKTGL